MDVICPLCKDEIAIADEYLGMELDCPLCGKAFTAPRIASAVAEPLPRLHAVRSPRKRISNGGIVACAFGLLMGLGAMLPWATIFIISLHGTAIFEGIVSLISAVAALALGLTAIFNRGVSHRWAALPLALGSVLSGEFLIRFIVGLTSREAQSVIPLEIGIRMIGGGLWLTVFAGVMGRIVVLFIPDATRRRRRRTTYSRPVY